LNAAPAGPNAIPFDAAAVAALNAAQWIVRQYEMHLH